MSSQEDTSARGTVAIIVAVLASFVCVLVLVALSGAAYLWLKERSKAGAQAKAQAAEVEELQAELEALDQDKQGIRIETTKQQKQWQAELDELRQAYASLEAGEFRFEQPDTERLGPVRAVPGNYPKPVETGVWEGELKRGGPDRPVQYTLTIKGPLAIQPYPDNERYTRFYAALAFNRDRSRFFVVDHESVLRRFNSNTLIEEMKLELGEACFDMELTSGGLALSFPSRNAVWMIDPESLNVLGEFTLEKAGHLAATPTGELAYAIGEDRAIAFDPVTRQVIHSIPFNDKGGIDGDAARFNNQLKCFAMHPGGKYLFTVDSDVFRGGLHQYAIVPNGIQYLATAPGRVKREGNELFISPDGSLIGMPGSNSMYLFDSNQIANVRAKLRSAGNISSCTLDTANGMLIASAVYGGLRNLHLMTYNAEGNLENAVPAGGEGKQVLRLEALPMGQRYLIWTNRSMWIADFQAERLMATIPEERHWSWEREKERRRLEQEAKTRPRIPQF